MKLANSHLRFGRALAHEAPRLAGFAATAAALAVFLAGCLPTAVHPFYRGGDVVQDKALQGTWKSADGKNSWTISPGAGKSYTIEIAAEDERVECVGHLFTIGAERFLDLYPGEQPLKAALEKNPYSMGLVPAHVLFRVRAMQPKLVLSSLGQDWLKELLKREPLAAAHVILPDDRVVLTGSSEALQAFVKQHLKDADAWNDMYEDGLTKVVVTKPAEK